MLSSENRAAPTNKGISAPEVHRQGEGVGVMYINFGLCLNFALPTTPGVVAVFVH